MPGSVVKQVRVLPLIGSNTSAAISREPLVFFKQ